MTAPAAESIDVWWSPAEVDDAGLHEARVVAIDVIRATTSIGVALDAGARSVRVAASLGDAHALARAHPGSLLCGERGGLPVAGFDLGNSPLEFTPDAVRGRRLVWSTSNGTPLIRALQGARSLALGSFRNTPALARWIAAATERGDAVRVACAGRAGRAGMDDAWCAGHLVNQVARLQPGLQLARGASAALELYRWLGPADAAGLATTGAGRALGRIGLADDLPICARRVEAASIPMWCEDGFRGKAGDGIDAD